MNCFVCFKQIATPLSSFSVCIIKRIFHPTFMVYFFLPSSFYIPCVCGLKKNSILNVYFIFLLQTFFIYHLWPHCQLKDVSRNGLHKKQDKNNVCIKTLESQWIKLLTNSWKYYDEGSELTTGIFGKCLFVFIYCLLHHSFPIDMLQLVWLKIILSTNVYKSF